MSKEKNQEIITFFKERLNEPSTWRGIILIFSGLIGMQFEESTLEAIICLCLSTVGLIGTIFPDKLGKNKP